MPRSVAELLPTIQAATASQDGLAPAALITAVRATFNPAAVDLSATGAYDDYAEDGAIALALAGGTHFPGAEVTVRRTGASVTVTVDGVTVFWADGDTGAKTWSDKQVLGLYYHPGLDVALALVPGDGTAGVTDHGALAGLGDNDHPQYALAANPVFTGTVTIPDGALAIADTSGLQAALDAKLALAGGTLTGLLRLIGLIQNYASAHTHGSAGAVAPNLASGAVGAIRVTLNANGTSWAPTNVPSTTTARYPVTVRFIQGAAGGFTLTLSALDWGTPGPPTLGTTAGDWLEVMMVYDHGTLYPRYVDSRTA